MNAVYLAGLPVAVMLPLIDESGEVIPATSVEYRVLRGDGTEVVAKTALTGFTEGDAEVQIAISGEANALTAPATREARIVEAYLLTTAGTIRIEHDYMVEADQPLVVGHNSYQTYAGSIEASYDLPGIPGWNEASKRERIAALISAWRNIERLPFVNTDDPLFLEARRRAQVIEADFLLGGDQIGDIRKAGLMSMTVGEAKQFFRPGKPIEGAVCKRAQRELSRWINTRRIIVRVG